MEQAQIDGQERDNHMETKNEHDKEEGEPEEEEEEEADEADEVG
jgi:hypothetical protein